MTVRRIYADQSLPDLSDDDEAAWRNWLKQHGIPDPNHMPLGIIECDDEHRQIHCEIYLRNEKGNAYRHRDGLALQEIVVQLEAPALPCPPGYLIEVLP